MTELPLPDLEEHLQTWANKPHAWQPRIRHDAHERTYELLHRDDHVEIYLVCWMPGHDTGFHDHDDSAAAIAVLDGEITEERLSLASGPVERTLTTGDTVTIAREAIHRVQTCGPNSPPPPCTPTRRPSKGSAPTK